MASPTGHQEYDANLLASAPVATKAQLQSGYNPDILAEKPTPPPSRHDIEAAIPAQDARDERVVAYPSQKQPFYRTKKGIIVIVVVLIVIIAAAVGGGVGGSKKKKTEVAPADSQSGGLAPGPASASGSSNPASSSNGQNVGSAVNTSNTPAPNPTGVPGVPITPTTPTTTAGTGNDAVAQLVGNLVGGH